MSVKVINGKIIETKEVMTEYSKEDIDMEIELIDEEMDRIQNENDRLNKDRLKWMGRKVLLDKVIIK